MFLFAFAPLFHLLQPALAASRDLKDNSASCDCYVTTSGSEPSYFTYHRFWDFRNLATAPDQYTRAPRLLTDADSSGNELSRDQSFLNSSDWNADWDIQDWTKEATDEFPIRTQNSPANVYIAQNATESDDNSIPPTWLTLRTSRLDDFQSAAEIENLQKNLLHASLRFLARVRGDPGAVAGLFTFFDETNESDIEILTGDANRTWRFTNQPSLDKTGDEVAGASIEAPRLPEWRDWREMRIDWVPGVSRWYVDGEQVAENTYSVPRKPSGLILNMWSDGGEWSGEMDVGGSAELHVGWVQMVFNTSGPVEGPGEGRGGRYGSSKRSLSSVEESTPEIHQLVPRKGAKACKVVCAVDGTEQEGVPEVVFTASAARSIWPALRLGGIITWLALWIAYTIL
ncbi:concanavalin A-like lectin/glucanase [Eremomyces bilateralis CBS 781.70]|uniref:Concanavalin A-like lectin/glucanase n=1 Tax=Eremomyces bilateralis CBS 781.70 TaxID=1392243 RepID=A0A6G1G8I8_9PEZI|nr:concanavalin A-like lectin/glucanase [Eremomyces bilateralis CBS 781.70]KAF1814343.1 concanavalin A-like lectin/glucanase [Eremomyces bilateralis CBS 781.70]